MRGQRRFHQLRKHRQPTGADRVVDPTQHPQHARIINRANVIGAKPARLGEGIGLHRVSIPLRQGRPSQHDPAVIDAHLNPVERDAVVDATAGRLTHPVRPHHRNACRRGSFGNAVRHRAAADQHRVQRRQHRSCATVTQRLVQLRGHQRRILATRPQCRHSGSQFGPVKTGGHHNRCRIRDDTPHQHLQPRDVIRRQRQQPRAGTAQPAVCGVGTGGQRRRGQHRPFGYTGRPRGRNHDSDVVVDRLVGAQRRCQQRGLAVVVGRYRKHRRTTGKRLLQYRQQRQR